MSCCLLGMCGVFGKHILQAKALKAGISMYTTNATHDIPTASQLSHLIHGQVQAEVSGSGAQGTTRQLVLTSAALIERHSVSYEVAEWRQLALIAALVRFIDQPQWLAMEWADGARPSMFITPARDALLAALLDAAQVSQQRLSR